MTNRTKSVYQLFCGLALIVGGFIALIATAPKHGDPLTPWLLVLISAFGLEMIGGLFVFIDAACKGALSGIEERLRKIVAELHGHPKEER